MNAEPIKVAVTTDVFMCLDGHKHGTYEVARKCIALTEKRQRNKEAAAARKTRNLNMAIAVLNGETYKSVAANNNLSMGVVKQKTESLARRAVYNKYGSLEHWQEMPCGSNLKEFREHKDELIRLINDMRSTT